jgi:alpha-N-arabinofuranosidase
MQAVADAVAARKHSRKRIMLSFDEWNVWYQNRAESKVPEGDDWPVAPVLLEDRYNVADAVVVGNLLISLLRHTDRVHAASLAQLVNVIAPIMTTPGGPAWRQTTFHPFALTARYAKGDVLRVPVHSGTYQTARFGAVPLVDAVATHDAATGEVALFAVNRSLTGPTPLEVDLRAFGGGVVVEAVELSNPDYTWHATVEDATSVLPKPLLDVTLEGGRLAATLPAVSWAMIRLTTR